MMLLGFISHKIRAHRKSRRPAWSASSKPPVTDLMSWCACWRVYRGWRRDGGHVVQEVLIRNLRDRRAGRAMAADGSPDESGKKRREKGLADLGNARGPARHDPTGMALSDVPEGSTVNL